MEILKSERDLMVALTTSLLIDIADDTGYVYKRDAREVRRRVTSEGVSFLTKTLPALGKALDKALSSVDGVMDYTGLKLRGEYPEFLGTLFQRVFDQAGRVLSDVSPLFVGHIRQILYLWYKYELPHTPEQKAAIESRFICTEAAIPESIPDCPVIQGARDLIARVCRDFSYQAIVPRHGPGAVATREQSWEKWRFKRLYRPLERLFPFTEWYIPSLSYLSSIEWRPLKGASLVQPLSDLEVLSEGTARAVLVPKDSRGPRLISCEPLEYQWIQQGIAAELIYCINKSEFTSGRVNFTSQDVNRWYALAGSAGAGWVTLDMKDASDRVSTLLVETLFGKSHVGEYLLCSRSHATVLPSGRLARMKKFAPMGSALCFPVESLVFFALAVNVLVHHCGVPLDKALERVKVYGDDLIVGSEDYAAIMQYFPFVGLMFNEAKCCTGGSFRESCGLDAFSGADVTPVKIRTRLANPCEPAAFVSAVEYSNALDYMGYWRTACELRDRIRETPWFGEIPYAGHEDGEKAYLVFRSHYLKTTNLNHKCPVRWNFEFQRQEVRGIAVRGHVVKRVMPGWERLFANIADNLPRSLKPLRNQKFYSSPDYYSCMSPTASDGGKRTAAMDRRKRFLTEQSGMREGLKTVMFPLRRRVTLIRRWCAE
jgi:hypothetical protein